MENIATESKKRKLHHDQEQEEENDEKKMEKFYALIKNIREARERLMNGSYETKWKEDNLLTKRSKLKDNKTVEVWKPTFQREDFAEETDPMKNPHHSVSTVTAGSSQIKQVEGTGKEEMKECLDLTLSL